MKDLIYTVPIPVTFYTSSYCLNVPFSKNEEANGVSTNSGMEMREAAVRLMNRYQHCLIKQLCTLTKPSSNISYSPLPNSCTCKLAAIMEFNISKRQSRFDNDNGSFYTKTYFKTEIDLSCPWAALHLPPHLITEDKCTNSKPLYLFH